MLNLAKFAFSTAFLTCIVGSPAVAAAQQSLVAYTDHHHPPSITDMPVSRAQLGLIGGLLAVEEGRSVASANNILSPAADMALQVAQAYAAGHDAELEINPILVTDRFSLSGAKQGGLGRGVRYVVDVSSVDITIIYAILNWTSFDIIFSSKIKIYDVETGKVIARSGCLVRGDHSDHFGHDALLANGAANLKMLIKKRSAQCVARYEADLGLRSVPALQNFVGRPELPQSAPYPQIASNAAPMMASAFSGEAAPARETLDAQYRTTAPTQSPSSASDWSAAPAASALPTPLPSAAVADSRRVVGIKVLADGAVQESYGP